MGLVRSAEQADLLIRIHKGGDDGVVAVVLYCEDNRPATRPALLKAVLPQAGDVTRVMIDAIADGWNIYEAAVEIEALDERRRK